MQRREQRVTLKQIAAQLGVHPTTVSRVLHADPDIARSAASPEVADRIRSLVATLGYSPDPQATSLRTRKTRLLGVIVPRMSDLVLASMYEGVEEAAAERGYSTFVSNSRDDPDEQRAKVEMMLARRVDGLILGDAHLDSRLPTQLAKQGVSFALMNRRHRSFPSATCDDSLGGRLVAEHLWERGHRTVALVGGAPYASTARDRTSGFVERWRAFGGTIPQSAVVWSRFDTAGGVEATETILASGRIPTAIFAVNDFAAIGTMSVLRARGIAIGKDCAVVGYNDTSIAAALPLPLSTVRSPMHEIGRTAVQLLERVLAGEEGVEAVRLRPSLQVRESSAQSFG